MIAIINYGLGNVGAFINMYKQMNIPAKIANNASDIEEATHVILPGVGAFDHAMDLLECSGMRTPLEKLVRQNDVPFLGVCVGMQMLAEGSDEGASLGLGWIDAQVRSFAHNGLSAPLPSPHMGWNDITPSHDSILFKGLECDARFYFLHSYYFECTERDTAAYANYGFDFACAVHKSNVFGVQFHPEKSHHWGAKLLKNFSEL